MSGPIGFHVSIEPPVKPAGCVGAPECMWTAMEPCAACFVEYCRVNDVGGPGPRVPCRALAVRGSHLVASREMHAEFWRMRLEIAYSMSERSRAWWTMHWYVRAVPALARLAFAIEYSEMVGDPR